MKFNFDSMEDTILHEFNGGTGDIIAKMYFDGTNRIMRATLNKGCSIGEHTHKTNCETIYVVDGTVKITFNGEEEIIEAGEAHFCEKGNTHKIEQYGDKAAVIFCSVPAVG